MPEPRGPAGLVAAVLRPQGTGLHGTLFVPESTGPTGAVLLIGGSGGREPAQAAEALATAGLVALSVAYFSRDGLPPQLRGIHLEYFFSALDYLVHHPAARDVPLALLGMSRGSEAAMLTAIHWGRGPCAVVASVPGNVVLASFPPGGPAWLLGGRPLPYVGRFGPDCALPEAIIPAERVPGPLLLVSAGADRAWPSAAMAKAISTRLESYGHSHGHQVLQYPDAGHSLGYLLPGLPAGVVLGDPGDRLADETARADAWPKVVGFLRGLRAFG